MHDFSHIPTPYGAADVQTFTGTNTNNTPWLTWQKPRGKSMAQILLIGSGGNGGNGAVGANSAAAGGGGGGSGAQTSIVVPLWAIPDILFLSLSANTATDSYVCVYPSTTVNHVLARAGGGVNGGNAAGATAGAVGGGGGVMSAGTMPLGWQWVDTVIAGQAGIIGGVAVAGAALTLPVTGLQVTGGTGGGGLPAAAASGTAGGSFTVPAAPSPFVAHAGGAVQATATNPANNGSHGYRPVAGLIYGYGGTGGGSTHGTATGGGLVASIGGDGAPGCGGGGGGGALTGSAVGRGGKGGPAFCIITCW